MPTMLISIVEAADTPPRATVATWTPCAWSPPPPARRSRRRAFDRGIRRKSRPLHFRPSLRWASGGPCARPRLRPRGSAAQQPVGLSRRRPSSPPAWRSLRRPRSTGVRLKAEPRSRGGTLPSPRRLGRGRADELSYRVGDRQSLFLMQTKRSRYPAQIDAGLLGEDRHFRLGSGRCRIAAQNQDRRGRWVEQRKKYAAA
jgi:hypothetical protein